DDSIACGICRRPHAGTHTGEQRSTVRSAFLGCNHFNGLAVDVGLNLPPDGRACAAATQPYRTRRDADLGEDAQGVLKAEGDALHDGANDMRTAMRRGESDQRAARLRIEMRGA